MSSYEANRIFMEYLTCQFSPLNTFQIRVVSKGKDGYMGVGLCASDVNMNRLHTIS